MFMWEVPLVQTYCLRIDNQLYNLHEAVLGVNVHIPDS